MTNRTLDAWYLTRDGRDAEESMLYAPTARNVQTDGGSTTPAMIYLSDHDYPATYPNGKPYVGSIDSVRKHRIYREPSGLLFTYRDGGHRYYLNAELTAAVEAFIEKNKGD